MTRQTSLLVAFLLGAVSAIAGPSFAPRIEGFWQADRANVSIIVEEVRDGIRVQRSDQNEWFYYTFIGQNEFANRRGQKYRFENNEHLVFVDDRRNRRISFYKAERNRGRDRDTYNDDFGYDDRFRNNDGRFNRRSNINSVTAARLMEGRWTNQRNGDRIIIRRRGRNVEFINNRRSRVYCPIGNGFFEDRFGNRLKLVGENKLFFRGARSGRPVTFRRGYDTFGNRGGRW
ncbi:MAG: hypothetical protein AAF242_10095 [Bacteroidota bacterium]